MPENVRQLFNSLLPYTTATMECHMECAIYHWKPFTDTCCPTGDYGRLVRKFGLVLLPFIGRNARGRNGQVTFVTAFGMSY